MPWPLKYCSFFSISKYNNNKIRKACMQCKHRSQLNLKRQHNTSMALLK